MVTRHSRRRNYVNVKEQSLEAVTKRAERANGRARAACFEQPDGVYSGCVDARPAKYTTCIASVFSVKGTVFGDGTVHDVLLAQFCAIHRPVDILLQICVAIPRLSGAGIFKAPARATLSTSICGSVSTVRFARSGRISFRLMAQRLEVSRG